MAKANIGCNRERNVTTKFTKKPPRNDAPGCGPVGGNRCDPRRLSATASRAGYRCPTAKQPLFGPYDLVQSTGVGYFAAHQNL
jgi:hypothetical protein